jgi:hypothetical protein
MEGVELHGVLDPDTPRYMTQMNEYIDLEYLEK